MLKLNLPECDLKLKNEEGNTFILDIIRKKYVVLTPEEWVRQHFIHLMITHLHYPKSLISVESGLDYYKKKKRSDIRLFNRDGSCFLMVECKSPSITFGQEILNQVAVYNKVTQANHVAVTNGMTHYIWKYRKDSYEQIIEFPKYA